MPKPSHIGIGIIAFPGAQRAAVLGLHDLFTLADQLAASYSSGDRVRLHVSHWHQIDPASLPEEQPLEADAPGHRLSALILPPMLGNVQEALPNHKLCDWLIERHSEGVVLASVCAGAFHLASTGIMNGRRMTTHWTYAETLQGLFPEVVVDTDQLIIDDGDVISGGGLMAWTDLGLRLVDRFLGSTVMLATARMLLVDPPGREQRYYSVFSPNLTHGDSAILRVQHRLQANHGRDVNLGVLAQHAQLEQRTFLRRFQSATGMTTTEYCQRLRVGRARELLQFSNLPIDRVAWDVGYADAGSFRRVFHKIVGLAPGEYRRRFKAGADASRDGE